MRPLATLYVYCRYLSVEQDEYIELGPRNMSIHTFKNSQQLRVYCRQKKAELHKVHPDIYYNAGLCMWPLAQNNDI